MDHLKTIFTRKSIRSFQDKPISPADLHLVLKAGMLAPSAGNERPWHFLIIDAAALKNQFAMIHPFAKYAKDAALILIVCGDLTLEKYPGNWPVDCGAACENMLLAAHGLHIGGVWCGLYPEQDRIQGLKQILKLPPHIIPFAGICLGYPMKNMKMDQENANRVDLSRVYYNCWNTQYF